MNSAAENSITRPSRPHGTLRVQARSIFRNRARVNSRGGDVWEFAETTKLVSETDDTATRHRWEDVENLPAGGTSGTQTITTSAAVARHTQRWSF
jgi:hypothetical protein